MINLVKTSKKGVRNLFFGKVFLFLVLFLFSSCESTHVIYTPQGYDITKPDKRNLGDKLSEISGISWVNDDYMLAQDDETGKIFFINLNDKKDFDYQPLTFGKKEDYEDIVKVDTAIYLLISDGRIVEVTGYTNRDSVRSEIVASAKNGNSEFESMYYDKAAGGLILLCKSCHKEKDKARTAFRFDLASKTLDDTEYYQIDIGKIRKMLNDNRAEFRPSAAAIQPLQNKLYILSSIGKLLVIADRKGNVEQAIPLSPSLFPQPEGITFADNGDMYISNEINTADRATLLKFEYKP